MPAITADTLTLPRVPVPNPTTGIPRPVRSVTTAPAEFNSLAYVLAGTGTVGTAAQPIRKGQLAVYGAGDAITLAAQQSQLAAEPNLEVLLLGGRPIREPVVQSGPFVMNTREEVVRAYDDYQAGRFGAIPAEHDV